VTLHLGKLAARRPEGLREFSAYLASALPTPPATVAAPNAQYPIDGNDQWGDCTIAGVAHLLAAWDVEANSTIAVPDGDAVVAEYQALTGAQQPGDSNDTGLDEANVLKTWQTSGLFGTQIAAYAPVALKDTLTLQQTIAFYGGAYLGIQCPQSAEQQFEANQPWTVVPGSPVEGGHCIVALGYDASGDVLCATWGGIATVTQAFLAKYLDEVWAIISPEFAAATSLHGGLDLASLQADLSSLDAPSPVPTPRHRKPWWQFW
jgi:hypothetical protein